MPALDAAREVAVVARGSDKPVLGAWLGALDADDVQGALEWGGVVNFYTPENAVDAFSFLAAYRRNQAWLLEVPPLQPEPEPLDLRTPPSICARGSPRRGARCSRATRSARCSRRSASR